MTNLGIQAIPGDTDLPQSADDDLAIRRSELIGRSLDNTAMQAYMECPRKYYYSMVLNRRRGGLTSPALAYGTAWHSALETHYRTGGDEGAVQRALIMAWQQHDRPDDHRTPERCWQAYRAWLGVYGSFEAEQRSWGTTVGWPHDPMVEITTEIWWPGAKHPYAVKIDRIFEHNGLFYVEDHKTSSALGTTYFRQFDPSNQMMGYAFVAGKLAGVPIAGVRINAHGVLKTQNKFERQTILFSPQRLEEWQRNYSSWVEKIETSMQLHKRAVARQPDDATPLEEDILLQAFPHNFNACAGKYGQCTYTDVCTSPITVRKRILDHDFEELPWDPMTVDDEAGE